MGMKQVCLVSIMALLAVSAAMANGMMDDCNHAYAYHNYGVHGYPQYGSWYGHQSGPDADYQARYGYGYDMGYYGGHYNNASLWYYGYLETYHNHSYKYHAADPAGPTGPWTYFAQGHYHRK